MNKIFKSILMFVLAFLFLLLGVAILPLISNLGEDILYLFVGFSILIYTYGLLLIKRNDFINNDCAIFNHKFFRRYEYYQ